MENISGASAPKFRKLAFVVLIAGTATFAATIATQTPASSRPSAPQSAPAVPEWAQPGSATHTQVAPPTDFHRPTTTFNTPIGIFDGQSDVGSAVLPAPARDCGYAVLSSVLLENEASKVK
jgi:hypothetical protein